MLNKKSYTTPLKHMHSGFTLIEVMVASVILFSVIATVSMVYRGAFLSSKKANEHINISAVIPSVLAVIQSDIRSKGSEQQNLLTGKSSAWEVKYQWQAKLLEEKSPPRKYDAFTNKLENAPVKYKLWQVQLTLEYEGFLKQYEFKELSWLNE